MFLQENMDIQDRIKTSSKEELRSLVRVWELDEITPKGGKDRSITKEHPRGLKGKRPNFMRENPPSWTWGWRCQNGANWGGKVHKDTRTYVREGVTEPRPILGSVREAPPFAEREKERAIRPWGRPQAREREEEGDHSWEGSLYSMEASTSGGGRRGPAKTPPEEKEDTVGSVTMINVAMSSTLMG
jgi:hypothetical protein